MRGGVTILKVARKLGRVSEPLVASLVRLVRAGVDPEAVRTLVRAGGRLDLTAARGAARAAVRPEALRGLRGLGGDVYGVYAAAGPRGVLEILGIARTTGEVARAERLAVHLSETEGEIVSSEAIQYLNRLSDFLFVASRAANRNGADDVLWVPGANR